MALGFLILGILLRVLLVLMVVQSLFLVVVFFLDLLIGMHQFLPEQVRDYSVYWQLGRLLELHHEILCLLSENPIDPQVLMRVILDVFPLVLLLDRDVIDDIQGVLEDLHVILTLVGVPLEKLSVQLLRDGLEDVHVEELLVHGRDMLQGCLDRLLVLFVEGSFSPGLLLLTQGLIVLEVLVLLLLLLLRRLI